jgi:hypothetical protein
MHSSRGHHSAPAHPATVKTPKHGTVKPAARHPAPHHKLVVQAPAAHTQHPTAAQPHALPPILS